MELHPAPTPPVQEPRPGARFALGSAVFFAVVAVVMTWPLAVRPGELFSSRQDAYLNVWNLWWVAHALFEEGDLLRSHLLLHPRGLGLESQPLSLLQTIAAAPLTAAVGPVASFSLLAVFAFALAGWAACAWIARVSRDAFAGLVGGAVFAFAPLHYVYLPELNLVATGFVPLWFLAAHRLRERSSVARGAVAGLALAAVGLSSWYYGLAVGLAALGETVWRLARARADERRQRALAFGAHWLAAGVGLAPLVLALLPAFADAPESWGTEREGFALWMEDFKGSGVAVALPPLVGWAALLLAAVALFARRAAARASSRATEPAATPGPAGRLRVGLALLAFAFALLSFGSSLELGDTRVPLPYALLSELPVVRSARYPDRFFVVALLAVAALAGLGAADLRRRAAGRAGPVAAALLLVLPLIEGWPGMLGSTVGAPRLPLRPDAPRGAVLHVPTTLRNLDGEAMLYQTRHGLPIAGGYRTRGDDALEAERRVDPVVGPAFLRRPPALDDAWVAGLRAAGFAHVALQRRPWLAGAAEAAPAPARVLGPFVLDGGRAFLRHRLFPSYPLHARLPELESAWRPELERLLGAPRGQSDEVLVFEVPAR